MYFFFQLVYNHLYKPQSLREVGTLKYFRERLNRRNVTPDKVTKSYEGCEQFIISTGKAYLIEAAMEFWGMDSMDDKPTKNCPPSNILYLPLAKKRKYFNKVVGDFVDEFVMADPDSEVILQHMEAETQASILETIQSDHDYASISVPLKEAEATKIKEKETDKESQIAVDKVR